MSTPSVSSLDDAPMSQEEFDRRAGRRPRVKKSPSQIVGGILKRRYVDPVRSWRSLGRTVLSFLPVVREIRAYSWRRDLVHDLIGGITIGFMHIPQGIAYSSLAGVPAVVGLYVSFFAPLFYAFLGTSRHASLGSFAVVALMAGTAVRQFSCGDSEATACNRDYSPVEVAATLTFVTGIVQIFLGGFGFSFMTLYFSDELVSGFTTGASMHVITTQIKDLLGYNPQSPKGAEFQLPVSWYGYGEHISNTNYVTLCLSLAAMSVLALGKYWINPLVKTKWKSPVPVPFELLVVIVGTVVSYLLDLNKKYGVKVVGDIPTGMPSPVVPRLGLFFQLLPSALSISVIVIAIHVSLAKMFAKKFKYPVDTNQEFYALGLSSVLSGFFPVYPLSTSLSRTIVNSSAGTRTQLSAVFSSLLILSLCLFAGQYLQSLPMCILASIVVIALLSMCEKFKEVKKLWTVSKLDMCIWLVSFLVTVIVDVVVGLAASICFALFTTVIRAQWVNLATLGEAEETYCNTKCYEFVETIVDVPVVRFNSPLIFVNAERFQDVLRRATVIRRREDEESDKSILVDEEQGQAENDKEVKAVVLDCSPFAYSDVMGIKALKEAAVELREKRIEFFLAATTEDFRDMIEDCDRDGHLPRRNFYPTVALAVAAASRIGEGDTGSTTTRSTNSDLTQ